MSQKEKPSYQDQLASYVQRIDFEDLSNNAITKLKHHLLDSIGCAINALTWEPVQKIQMMLVQNFDPQPNCRCTIMGFGGKGLNAPQVAAFWNGALVRYVDFMDFYMAKMQTCHPSDNIASILAASECQELSGRDFL